MEVCTKTKGEIADFQTFNKHFDFDANDLDSVISSPTA